MAMCLKIVNKLTNEPEKEMGEEDHCCKHHELKIVHDNMVLSLFYKVVMEQNVCLLSALSHCIIY